MGGQMTDDEDKKPGIGQRFQNETKYTPEKMGGRT